jgi:hypothetical protein
VSVHLSLRCGGCPATIEVGPLRRRYVSIYPGSNISRVETDEPEDLIPEGWIMFDPYTLCTYCPECWAGIEASTS